MNRFPRALALLTLFLLIGFESSLAAVDPPLLVAPADSAVDLPTEVTYQWQAVPGATLYTIQISTDPAFAALFNEDDSLTTTSVRLDHNFGTRYYWRVIAFDDTSQAVSETRTFRTRTSDFVKTTLLAPANGATGLDSTVEFDWTSLQGAPRYRLEVDDDPAFSSPDVVQDSLTASTYTATGLSPGTVYYWRVETVRSDTVRGYSDTWSFTTTSDLPQLVTLLAPADGSVDLDVEVTYEWAPVDSAQFYTIQISTDSTFATLFNEDDSLTTTSARLDHNFSSTYYWRVLVQTPSTRGTSPTWSFTTRPFRVLGVPLLISPADNAANLSTSVSFTWGAAANAQSYRLLVAEDADFLTLAADRDSLADTTAVVSGLARATTYYWKVEAVAGTRRTTSQTRQFTTTSTLAAPTLLTPPNGASDRSSQVRYSWEAVADAQSYRLQVSRQQDFSTLFNDISGLTATALTIGGHASNTLYYWRVIARSATDSSTSTTWQFSTLADVLAAPTLVGPADNATGLPTSVTFFWQPVPGAATYQVQVATDPQLTALVHDIDGLTGTSVQLNHAPNTTHYWRVVAKNAIAATASTVRTFTTGTPVDIERDASILPDRFALLPNYPNPFNPTTTLTFDLPEAGPVAIRIYDAVGREVAHLVDGDRAAGRYRVVWQARDLPSGLYFARMDAGAFRQVRTMMLMK